MNAGGYRSRPPSAWKVETERLRELYERWLDYRLNKFFDLSIHGPGYRRYWILVLGAGFVAGAFAVHSILYFFPILAPPRPVQFSALPLFILLTVVRLLLLLFIPSFVAVTIAGNYLADIFELKDTSVAWNFISDLSINGANEVVHIRDGKVTEDSLHSPVLWIGGPGRVDVEFDSAALFEKPDGTPHVIGPDSGEEDEVDNTILEGFERLREPIINLRDQYIGNPSAEPMRVASRSQDGIVVSAADVRAVFSVYREKADSEDEETSSPEIPYTFQPESIQNLIYQQAVPVLTEGPYPSGEPGNWADAMKGLLGGSLADFMSKNKLVDYLTSIGTQERELSEFREDTILSRTLQHSEELPETTPEEPSESTFHPRTELSDRFRKYAQGFSRRAHERGLELHWIGVGTWEMPNRISSDRVDGQHLEAWRINSENTQRSSPETLEKAFREAYQNEKLRLIQAVPVAAHQKNQSRFSEKNALVDALLQDYWEQLGDALDICYQNGNSSRELETIEKGVLKVEQVLGLPKGRFGQSFSRVRPRPSRETNEDAPPAPRSRAEEKQYQFLLGKMDGNYKVVEGIIAHEAQRYPDLSRAEHIQRVFDRFQRYDR